MERKTLIEDIFYYFTMILLYDSGFVERKCPSCKRHETYYSLADAFVTINKTIDRKNTIRILQSAIYVEKGEV